MSWLHLVLRIIHIGAGVCWAGAAFVFAGFVEPSVSATGQEGRKVMQRLAGGRYPLYMSLGAVLTTLSGLWLYWRDSGGLNIRWIASGPGIAFTLGGAAGLAAAVLGMLVSSRSAARMKALAAQIQAAGGPPQPAQLQELEAFQQRLRSAGQWGAFLLALTVLLMASARYLNL